MNKDCEKRSPYTAPGLPNVIKYNALLNEITNYVAGSQKTTMEEIKGDSREGNIKIGRQICMYMLQTGTTLSSKEIGKYYRKSAGAVRYSVDVISSQLGEVRYPETNSCNASVEYKENLRRYITELRNKKWRSMTHVFRLKAMVVLSKHKTKKL